MGNHMNRLLMIAATSLALFACSAPVTAFDTQREVFLGPYRGFDSPIAVEEGRCRPAGAGNRC